MWPVRLGSILYIIVGLFEGRYSHSYWYSAPYDDPPGDGNMYRAIWHSSYLGRFGVYAGVYSAALEAAALACVNDYLPSQALLISQNSDWFPVLPEELTFQAAMTTKINSKGDINIVDWTDMNWYFRPHSKAELEAAGLWPTGE